jgi:hypothetical protein
MVTSPIGPNPNRDLAAADDIVKGGNGQARAIGDSEKEDSNLVVCEAVLGRGVLLDSCWLGTSKRGNINEGI